MTNQIETQLAQMEWRVNHVKNIADYSIWSGDECLVMNIPNKSAVDVLCREHNKTIKALRRALHGVGQLKNADRVSHPKSWANGIERDIAAILAGEEGK